MTEQLMIKKSKVKENWPTTRFSSDFAEELENKTKNLVEDAIKRSKNNGRETVMARDL